MSNIGLKDILISARQESYRMRHFYLGAEHLFIALLEIKGGLAASILQEHGGLTPEYVIDAIRRKLGKGSKHRLWAGIPNTPRTDVLLGIASDLALESGREDIYERDLLVAILDENDSIPIRVLNALGLNNMPELAEAARNFSLNRDSQRPYVRVDFGPDFDDSESLNRDQLFVLRRMFFGYSQIRVERRLTGGYTSASLLVVTPIHGDSREDAAVVVKIDSVDVILDEAQRYDALVKNTLPPMTARLEDKPVAPETSELAGLKYTLVADDDQPPRDLRAGLDDWEPAALGNWLRTELYPTFGRIWWQQGRPYRFQVWREYDWLLPPILTVEAINDKKMPADVQNIKFPIKRTRLNALEYGDTVAIENFIVQKVYPDRNTILLAVSHGHDAARAFQIEVRGLDLERNTYYRGEVIESIAGTVWKTRHEQLVHALRSLEPDFDLNADKIAIDTERVEKIPNPISSYEELLDSYINGKLSTIHGDMHLGNVITGPNRSAFLIDFAHTRDGHTVFDWATMEISLLSDLVMPAAGEDWDDARSVLQHIQSLNGGQLAPDSGSKIATAMEAVTEMRKVVRQCLLSEEDWAEYYVALALGSLRAITWETMPLASRRLMFLVAGLAINELRTRHRPGGEGITPTPDETDFSNMM